MAPSSLNFLLGLSLVRGALAQSTTETVWSSFAYVYHGERTPVRGEVASNLTPLGAQQLHSQGSLFRDRYLSNSSSSSSDGANGLTTSSPIVGLEKQALDNSQLEIFSGTDDYISGSAMAFMQGLYPPVTETFAYNNGGDNASTLANGSTIDYPLGGYQYPNIRALSVMDPSSVWLEGHTACSEYWSSSYDFRDEPSSVQTKDLTSSFYEELWSDVFPNTVPKSMVNSDYAYDLYEYALYEYNHNETVHDTLTEDQLANMRNLANDQQFALNGNLSVSGLEEGDMIRAISGRMLAAKVVAQLSSHMAAAGDERKLTLMFGSFEPFLAFFALSNLSSSDTTDTFTQIPQPGAAMVFELFTIGSDTSSYPASSDLWVRFLYRNGTDADVSLQEYPLFGRGNSETRMRWDDFAEGIDQFSINDLGSWCDTCDAVTLYCSSLGENSDGSGSGSGSNSDSWFGSAGNMAMSPAVAGVIGAVIAIAILGLASAAAFVFGGVRLRRNETGRRGTLGGFKGAEKMASDHDVSIAKGGARHERVGSWELGGPGSSAGAVPPAKIDGNVFGASVRRNGDDDGDSIMGRAPIRPLEGV